MQTENSLGQWPNAPLAYVVAELTFQQVPGSSDKFGPFAELLAEEYPIYSPTQMNVVTIGGNVQSETVTASDLRDFDNVNGIRVTPTSMAVHTVAYRGWDAFRDQLAKALEALKATVAPRVVARLALRYIDLIVPAEGASVADYLAPELRPWAPSDPKIGTLDQHNRVIVLKDQENRVVMATSMDHIRVPMTLPPNLPAIPIKLSTMQQKAMKCYAENRAFGMLDVQATHESAGRLDIPSILESFRCLHDKQSALFNNMISERALREWKEEA
ncbi:TIGR04255 family protein [Paraburkholderia sp. J63]|uniref:TIGR04255 family protein n=1 Tax=Paraburkholderia sp. J63 TaxID=2805434 RepID=UPI002ABE4666|nr:TIGR04255 family protein [Paraburkholderia sp. J63]